MLPNLAWPVTFTSLPQPPPYLTCLPFLYLASLIQTVIMGITIELMTNFQLCLAHYCDIHGPTPLMVTEGITAPCTACYEETEETRSRGNASVTSQPSSHLQSDSVSDALRGLKLGSPTSENDAQVQRQSLLRSGANTTAPSANLETPPESPRPIFQQPRRDSSYRRTYDETVTRKQGPCDNCAMTLPRVQESAKGAGHLDPSGRPTLRTRAPVERVFGSGGQASPPHSQASSETDGEREEEVRPSRNRHAQSQSAISSRTASCSTESTVPDRAPFHVHYVNYTSTHEPVVANSFTLLRAACLRALSFETLPRAPNTSQTSSPTSTTTPSFVTTQSAGSAGSGGPIFFGDSFAGYTTAYIFRIPDVHARGHKRVYAFLAVSTHKERLAMKTFAFISNAFRDLALHIQQLAEAEAERVAESSPIGSMLQNGAFPSTQRTPTSTPASTVDRSESSFLTGGGAFTRRTGGGGSMSAPKARGLAELVGQPDFFINLHGRFVQLLLEVGVTLSSWVKTHYRKLASSASYIRFQRGIRSGLLL